MSKITVVLARLLVLHAILRSTRFHLGCMGILTLLLWPLLASPRDIMIAVHGVLIWRIGVLQFGYRSRDSRTQRRLIGKILDTAGLLVAALVLSTGLLITTGLTAG